VGSTDVVTLSSAVPITPTGTITYTIFGTAPSSGSGGSLTAADVWAYTTRTLTAATNITSTGGTIPITASRVDASVGAYQTGLTPLQPTTAGRTLDVSATGEAGIDWANVGSPTTTINLSGTTISTSQAVASVSGAVGSVTGNVGGNVTGSVGSVATGGITATSIATDAIGAAELAADAVTEIQSGLATSSGLSSVGLSAAAVDSIWDEAKSGHTTAGTYGFYLDSAISGVSTGGVSAATIADAVWDEARTGHTSAGTFGFYLDSAISGVSGGGGLDAAGVRAAIGLATANLDTQLSAIDDYVDTEVAAIKTKTDFLPSATAGASGGLFIAGTNAATNITGGLTANITGNLSGSVGSVTDDLDAAAVRTAIGLATANLDTQLAALQSDTDNIQTRLPTALVSGRMDSSVGAIPMTLSEPAAKPSWTSSTLAQWIAWIGAWSRNEVQQTSTQKILRNDADTSNLVTCAVSDNGTTFEVSECTP
jgi:hypothetical protein